MSLKDVHERVAGTTRAPRMAHQQPKRRAWRWPWRLRTMKTTKIGIVLCVLALLALPGLAAADPDPSDPTSCGCSPDTQCHVYPLPNGGYVVKCGGSYTVNPGGP